MKVALVNMPFGSLHRPSIGLSLLQAALEEDKIPCDIHYLNLLFSSYIGHESYDYIVEGGIPQAAFPGEWVFSQALYQVDNYDEYQKFLNQGTVFRNKERRREYLQRILQIREQVEPFLAQCMDEVPWAEYDVIGFTSVFEQNVASLSLAKRLKERFPDKFIIFGGANCEGIMGQALLEEFPFLDAVCSGEGDISFRRFINEFSQKGDPSFCQIPGILLQSHLTTAPMILGEVESSEPVSDMDRLPYPNYVDYFRQYVQNGLQYQERDPRFLFESSRGCWWGAKSHCMFCGLNGSNMTYRSKSADRALEELLYLREKYKEYTHRAAAVDNIIDMKYFRDFLPKIRDMQLNLDMFYETKANLTKEQVKLFHEADFHFIQPGIESLITSVLRLMRKGVSMMQNVQLMKWCSEYGVLPYWNFLYGFPGENPKEYGDVISTIRALTHLEPPGVVARIRLDRFSPYFNDAESYGIVNVRPMEVYKLVYQEQSEAALRKMAYYFEFDYADQREPSTYTGELVTEVLKWQEQHQESELFHVDLGDTLLVVDLRPVAQENFWKLTGLEKTLYLYCDNVRSVKTILDYLEKNHIPHTKEEVQQILDRFLQQQLMLTESGVYLTLSIPLGHYQPGKRGIAKLLEIQEAQTKSESPVSIA